MHLSHEGHEEALSGFVPWIILRALRVLRGERNHLLYASNVFAPLILMLIL
jgi:hypothetical protein